MGSMKVSPNMASRQSQLWFSVTSLIQYVRHDFKGGQKNGEKAQQEESKTLFVYTAIGPDTLGLNLTM